MRVKFYVDGSKRKGTVHVDLKKVRLSDVVKADVITHGWAHNFVNLQPRVGS